MPRVNFPRSMASLSLGLPAALLATTLAAHGAGSVEVNYIKPEAFTDAGRSAFDRDRTLQSLTTYLQSLGQRLPTGQVLRLDVTDIDLAGTIEPVRHNDVRVLRGGADWPHLNLHYALQEGSRTLKAGDARLADMNYLLSSPHAGGLQGDLPYEKRMLQSWFQATFIAP